ncbi:oligosaccharide flippase family protein [Alphaproteobacteria bacterium]|nr:oligosaccharide flippase family protein [Alphaproteobacteria bacterium]
MSSSLIKHYIGTSSLAALAKIFKVFAALAMVWFVNAMVGKSGFGLYTIAFAYCFVVSSAIAACFQSLILYHVPRLAEGEDSCHLIARSCLWWALLFSVLAVGVTVVISPFIEAAMDKDGLAYWLNLLSVSIPFQVGLMVLTGWYRARHEINVMTLYFDVIPGVLMVGLIALAWLLTEGALWIGVVQVACVALPFVVLFVKRPLWLPTSLFSLSRWDWIYGLKTMGTHIVNQPFRGLDVMLVGAFAGLEATADYALAVRFSQLLMLPKQSLAQPQIPRLAQLFKDNDLPKMVREFHAMRDVAFAGMVVGLICYILFAQPVMMLFGPYENAYFILMLLACSAVIRTGYGEIGGYLLMAGYAGWALLISALSVAVMVTSMSVLIPEYGSYGSAYAVIVTAFASMSLMAIVILRKDGWSILTPASGLFLIGSCLLLLLVGHQIMVPLIAAGVFILLQIVFLFVERTSLEFFQISIKRKLRR